MKKFIFLFTLFAFSAAAAEIKVLDVFPIGFSTSGTSQKFEVNKDLGRAWVSISLPSSDPEAMDNEYRVKVPGLSFNAANSTVELVVEGKIVECADVYETGRWAFRQTKVKLNGNCRFEHRYETVSVDDGFEIKEHQKFRVYLITE